MSRHQDHRLAQARFHRVFHRPFLHVGRLQNHRRGHPQACHLHRCPHQDLRTIRRSLVRHLNHPPAQVWVQARLHQLFHRLSLRSVHPRSHLSRHHQACHRRSCHRRARRMIRRSLDRHLNHLLVLAQARAQYRQLFRRLSPRGAHRSNHLSRHRQACHLRRCPLLVLRMIRRSLVRQSSHLLVQARVRV